MLRAAHKFSQKILGEGGQRLVSTAFLLLLARYVGAEGFGRYSTALAYATLCVILVDLGTNFLLTREIARHPEERVAIANASHLLKIAAAVGSWVLLYILLVLLHVDAELRNLTLCLAIMLIGFTLTEYFSALLSGIEEMGWEAVLKFLSRTLALLFGFWGLATHQSLHGIASLLPIGAVASYLLCVGIVRYRFGSFGLSFNIPLIKRLLSASMPIFVSAIFWVLYDTQDVLLLNYFRYPQADVGYFSAAMKVIDLLRVYPVLLIGALYPSMSKLHLSDTIGFESKKYKLILFLTLSMSALSALVFVTSPWIIRILYKSDFAPTAKLLQFLAPALILVAINHAQMQLLIAKNMEKKLFFSAIILSASHLFWACVLLPKFGVPGMCLAMMGSEMANFIYLYRIMPIKRA